MLNFVVIPARKLTTLIKLSPAGFIGRFERRLASLAVVTGVFSAVIVLEIKGIIMDSDPFPSIASVTAKAKPKSHPEMSSKIEDNKVQKELAAALARPLFTPGRHVTDLAAAGTAEAPLQQPRLAGIIITPTTKLAIFTSGGGGNSIIVTEGQHIANSVVESILPSTVRLLGPAGETVLSATFDHSAAALKSPQAFASSNASVEVVLSSVPFPSAPPMVAVPNKPPL